MTVRENINNLHFQVRPSSYPVYIIPFTSAIENIYPYMDGYNNELENDESGSKSLSTWKTEGLKLPVLLLLDFK